MSKIKLLYLIRVAVRWVRYMVGVPDKRYPREISIGTLVKSTSIIAVAPLMLLVILVAYGELAMDTALYSAGFVFVISFIFVRPYVGNLSALTHYVKQLSLDEKAEAPDLSFLNNVEELTEAVSQLHSTWESRRKQLEGMVAESRILIDSLPDILIMLDKKREVIRTNTTARQVFGGKYFKDTLKQILSDMVVSQAVTYVLNGGEGRNIYYYLGEPFNCHYMVRVERFPAHSPGDIAVMLVLHDVTEQKHNEQVQSDFVANASHEIRTPLTSLMGFVETLQNVAKDDPEVQKKFLKIMYEQAERMAKLVNGLLSLSQIERNIYMPPTERVNISTILRDVQAHVRPSADEKDMVVNLQIKGKLPQIIGDTTQLMQVFDNLVLNAIKYGPEGTAVAVRARLIDNMLDDEKKLREFDQLLEISVTDEGDGIAEEHIPRLTERFYRVDAARSRKVGGTGLGLSIVKYVLERHHGVLHVESELEKGSVFTVFLPVQKS